MSEIEQRTKELCGTCGLPHYGLTGYNHNFVSRASNQKLDLIEYLREAARGAFPGRDEKLGRQSAYWLAADEIERRTPERDDWAAKGHKARAELAELKYPGMKGIVRPMSGPSDDSGAAQAGFCPPECCNHALTLAVSACLGCGAVLHGAHPTAQPPRETWCIPTDELLKLTEALDEHPEGWEWPCMCAECRSHADD